MKKKSIYERGDEIVPAQARVAQSTTPTQKQRDKASNLKEKSPTKVTRELMKKQKPAKKAPY